MFKEKLATELETKDIGKLKYFLGIEVAHSKQGIFISQGKYMIDLKKKTDKLGWKLASIPIEQSQRMGTKEKRVLWFIRPDIKDLWGKLIYLTHTKSRVPYKVSIVTCKCA